MTWIPDSEKEEQDQIYAADISAHFRDGQWTVYVGRNRPMLCGTASILLNKNGKIDLIEVE